MITRKQAIARDVPDLLERGGDQLVRLALVAQLVHERLAADEDARARRQLHAKDLAVGTMQREHACDGRRGVDGEQVAEERVRGGLRDGEEAMARAVVRIGLVQRRLGFAGTSPGNKVFKAESSGGHVGPTNLGGSEVKGPEECVSVGGQMPTLQSRFVKSDGDALDDLGGAARMGQSLPLCEESRQVRALNSIVSCLSLEGI